MPTISTFYGITIMVRLREKDHDPPHIHAVYGEYRASFSLKDGEFLTESKFPIRASQMVKEFILENQKELLEMWNTQKFKKLKGLN